MRGARLSVIGLLLLVVAPHAAAAVVPQAVANPSSGTPGSSTTITASGFIPNSSVEIRGGSTAGPLLGSGTLTPNGTGAFPVNIPANAPVGPYPVVVCSVSPNFSCGAGTSEVALAPFTVTPLSSTTTPTTTVPPLITTSTTTSTTSTTTTSTVPILEGCAIPAGADVIDFDDFAAGIRRFETPTVFRSPGGREYMFGTYEFGTVIPDGVRFDGPYRPVGYLEFGAVPMGSVSPPNAVHTDQPLVITLFGPPPAYIGLHLGLVDVEDLFGRDYPDFPPGEPRAYHVVVSHLPYVTDVGLETATMGSALVMLGPEPGPVNVCVIIPLDIVMLGDGFGDTVITIQAIGDDGSPNDYLKAIDSLFYGVEAPPPATHPEVPPHLELPPGAIPPIDDGAPWGVYLLIAFTGLFIGGSIGYVLRRRRS